MRGAQKLTTISIFIPISVSKVIENVWYCIYPAFFRKSFSLSILFHLVYYIHTLVHKYVETLDGTIPRVLFTIKYVWYANYDELVPQEYGILVSNLVKKIKNFKGNLSIPVESLSRSITGGQCPFKHTYNIHFVRWRFRRMFFK